MSDLCLSCGMCCDGTLGIRCAEVTPEEAIRFARRLPIVDHDLLLPCTALDGCRCTTYDDRPAVCGRYRCDVLEAVEEGATTFDEAAELIARTRALAASIRARVPGTDGLWSDLSRHGEDTLAWRRAHGELLMEAGVLRELVRRFDDRIWAWLRSTSVER